MRNPASSAESLAATPGLAQPSLSAAYLPGDGPGAERARGIRCAAPDRRGHELSREAAGKLDSLHVDQSESRRGRPDDARDDHNNPEAPGRAIAPVGVETLAHQGESGVLWPLYDQSRGSVVRAWRSCRFARMSRTPTLLKASPPRVTLPQRDQLVGNWPPATRRYPIRDNDRAAQATVVAAGRLG